MDRIEYARNVTLSYHSLPQFKIEHATIKTKEARQFNAVLASTSDLVVRQFCWQSHRPAAGVASLSLCSAHWYTCSTGRRQDTFFSSFQAPHLSLALMLNILVIFSFIHTHFSLPLLHCIALKPPPYSFWFLSLAPPHRQKWRSPSLQSVCRSTAVQKHTCTLIEANPSTSLRDQDYQKHWSHRGFTATSTSFLILSHPSLPI